MNSNRNHPPKNGNKSRLDSKPEQPGGSPAINISFWEDVQVEEVPHEILEQILAQRAALIARPLEEEEKGEQIELVLFRIGKELYGLEVQSILDIHLCTNITHLPRVPKWISGLTNIGGHILAVLDLQPFLGLSAPETQSDEEPARPYLIRLVNQEYELALLVEEVLSIENIAKNKVQETTDAIRGLPPEYVRGVYNRNTGENALILILDLTNLLADPRLIIRDEIL